MRKKKTMRTPMRMTTMPTRTSAN
jgi:hypothetical protein